MIQVEIADDDCTPYGESTGVSAQGQVTVDERAADRVGRDDDLSRRWTAVLRTP